MKLKRFQHANQMFTAQMESELASYLTHCSLMNHGLTPLETRQITFAFAVANKVTVPLNWEKKKEASRDWFTRFVSRNQTISIRSPEATSQSRASGFNAPVVAKFYESLNEVLTKNSLPPHKIWNGDESGIPTVIKPPKVISVKGLKKVQQTVSNKRGVNTTMLAFVSASGTSIPPVYIFPRKKLLASMGKEGPTGCLAIAHPSGWINAESFLRSLQHFVEYTGCPITNKHILLLDNHSSHLDYSVVSYARETGIIMLTFPPHCSHRLQPLDVSVFGPFKAALKASFNAWLNNHPGERISIHEVAGLSRKPYMETFKAVNICSGFRKAGIFPYNPELFTAKDFLPSYATDINPVPVPSVPIPPVPTPPIPTPSVSIPPIPTPVPTLPIATPPVPVPSLPTPAAAEPIPVTSESQPFIPPSVLRPYLKVSMDSVNTSKKNSW